MTAAPLVLDELAAALAALPLLAACGPSVGAEVWTADVVVDAEELAVAERVCRRCPVLTDCRAYASQSPVWGMWAGTWHDGKPQREKAA